MYSPPEQTGGDPDLIHEGLIYDSDEELAELLVPFLREGVAAGQPTFLALDPEQRDLVLARLGDVEGPSILDSRTRYARPGTALFAWSATFEEALAGGAEFVRAVGHPPVEATLGREERWLRYESLFNRLFADAPIWLICPYGRNHSDEALLRCRKTHPTMVTAAGRAPSPDYFASPNTGAPFATAGEIDGREISSATAAGPAEVVSLRRAVVWPARNAGFSVSDAQDLVLAVTELAHAAIDDSAGPVTVRTAATEHAWYCEIALGKASSTHLSSGRGRVALAVGSIVCDRVELADEAGGSATAVRFVFATPSRTPRERILAAATTLFGRNGIRAATVNAIAAEANVAKATFYSLFPSKDQLVVTWLAGLTDNWVENVIAEIEARAESPRERLHAWFDVLGEWVEEDIAAGSPVLRTANEARAPQHPARDAHREGSRRLHDYLHETASAAGIPDPDRLIEEFELLAQGVISEAARSSTPRAAHVAAHAATRLLATALPE